MVEGKKDLYRIKNNQAARKYRTKMRAEQENVHKKLADVESVKN